MTLDEYKKAFIKLMLENTLQLPRRSSKSYSSSLQELLLLYKSKISFLSENTQKEIHKVCDLLIEMSRISSDDARMSLMEEVLNIVEKHMYVYDSSLPMDGFAKKNVNLFRIRKVERNCDYDRNDIFHQPISAYRYVRPYRYNLAGCPSLYLGTTIYSCRKETNVKEGDMVIASLFRLNPYYNKPLYILDMGVRPVDFIKDVKNGRVRYRYENYLYIYPLIAACSFIVSDDKGSVIPEYQISNALLRWLVKHHGDMLCGIRYFSCSKTPYYTMKFNDKTVDERDSRYSFTRFYINYVFPVENLNRELHDFSLNLRKAFLVSKPKHQDFRPDKEFESSIKYNPDSLSEMPIKVKV